MGSEWRWFRVNSDTVALQGEEELLGSSFGRCRYMTPALVL